jgi:hypothetical protein
MTWSRALRAAALAAALVVALVFAVANFVVVDVRVLVFGFQTRLAWVVLVPVGLAFAGGVAYSRRTGRAYTRDPDD